MSCENYRHGIIDNYGEINLSISAMEELTDFIEKNPEPRELKRALAVKMVVQNYSYYQISDVLQVSVGFISKWKQIFAEQGIMGLLLKYRGSKSYLTSEQQQAITDWLKQKNYWHLPEIKQHIQDNYNVVFESNQSYYDIFPKAGISWKKTQKSNPRKDPELVEKKTGNHSMVR